ncbi:calcium homeostasis modulator protein 6 [Aplochiton taeniatus]
MDMFKTALNVANKQQTNLGFGLVALLTACSEQIFSSVVFRCPCSNWNFWYGMVFLIVPALALLILGYILSNKTWKLFTGLCLRNSKFRWNNIWSGCTIFVQITTASVVAPTSWIAVALLNGNFLECALTGLNVTVFRYHLCGQKPLCQADLYKLPCNKQLDQENVLGTLRAESQIIGWLLIASIVLSYLLITCVARCNSPISYMQLKFWRVYTQEENKQLEKYSAEHARKLAERNIQSFFQLTSPETLTTPPNKAWNSISSFFRFGKKNQYYSVLHQYVEKYQKPSSDDPRQSMSRNSVISDGPAAANPAVLTFVDDGMML